MLSQLLRQLISSFGIFFRTIRAFFTRRLMGVKAYVRRVTNFSRQATKVASASLQEATAAVKKPTKREDYIETERLFISKSFLILAAIALVLFALFCYFVAWPFILSHFLTARFYQEDRRIPEWTGKVIVYYDKAKHIPMYSGTLTDGVLQGPGMEYDEDGLLIYEGDFIGGARNGNGTAYEAGVLVYEGQFQNGVYEGSGSLHKNGALAYRGAFASGLPNGLGTAYDGGTKCYEGAFADGMYEGEGAAYDRTGWMYYKGSFAAGLYDGSGTVFLKNGDRIQSEFSAGVGGGVIQWYKSGRLWYDGGADDLTPNGFGTIYAPSGKVIYSGEMDHGTLDGGWMLGLTAEELREAFGEASVTEADRNRSGFLMINKDLGLTVLCAYRQEEEEAHAHRIWFAPEEKSDAASLLPWADRKDAERWAGAGRDPAPAGQRTMGKIFLPEGNIGGNWYQSVYTYEDHARALVSRDLEEAPFQLIWAQLGGFDLVAADTQSVDESMAQAQERLDELLDVLESVGGMGGPGGGENSGAAADPADVERLLGLMQTWQDAYDLMNALTDYYVYGQAVKALEASRPLLEQNLVEQQRLLERNQTTQDAVDSGQDHLDSLDRQLAQYRISQERAGLIGERLTGLKLDGYNLEAVLRVVDVSGLDAAALYDGALDYAVRMAAGRYEVDKAQLELDVKTQVLDLTLAYENVLAGQQSLERAAAFLDEAMQAYAMGTTDKATLYDAQCGMNDAAAAQFQLAGAYTKLVNQLNRLSGGWPAEEYDWFAEPFGILCDMAVRQAEAEAEAEKQRPAELPPDKDLEELDADPEAEEPSGGAADPETGDTARRNHGAGDEGSGVMG